MDTSVVVKGLMEKLTGWLETIGQMTPNLALTALVLVAAWYAAKGVQKGASKALERSKVNDAARGLVSTLLRVLVVLAGLSIALGILELDKALASMIAGAGVIGLALGFAFQDLAANLISGVGLAVNRTKPFQLGDLVETNDEFGKVTAVDLRTSTITTLDGKIVVIPNKQIYQSKVINHSASGLRRIDIPCGVSYGDDLETVTQTVLRALEPFDEQDGERPAQVMFTEFGDSSINFVARFWVDYESEGAFLQKKSAALCAIFEAFNREGITIPFPIRTLDFGQVGGTQLRQELEGASLHAAS